MAPQSRVFLHRAPHGTGGLLLAATAAVVCLEAFACSAASPSVFGKGSGGASPTATSSSSSSSSGTSGQGGFSPAGSSASSGMGGGCAGHASTATPVPLDILVMLDQSGSMSMDAGNNLSRWQNVKAAITTFVQQPNVSGIGMGIQYFGLPLPNVTGCTAFACATDADCTNGCTVCGPGGVCHAPFNPDVDTCDPGEYAWAEVPIQPLPGAGGAILSSIGMHAPGTNTPTLPALQGAIQYASVWAKAHPTHITVVALATDGEPGECDVDLTHIDGIAAAGFAAAPSIRTFVIGVGPSTAALDGIAAAGGTGAAYHVDMNMMATQQLVQLLNTIRGAALACTYQIPPPPAGKTEDFTLVNVAYVPGMGPTLTVPQVAGSAACPTGGDGWYYDDPASPTQIILCPTTCGTVSKDPAGAVDVVLGCKTITK